MKSIKNVSIFILSLLVFTIISCDDEPLEGDFITDGGGNEVSCVAATQNLATASTAYGTTSTDDANYAVICNAYAVALQNMINACGDETGSIQTLLEALNCPPISDDCANAQTASANAATAYNADTTNSSLCNAYEAALQNEIAQCGDADGSLQSTIDGLSCEDTNQESLFIKQIITDELNGTSFTETFSYDGNNLTSILDSDGFETTYVYENDLLIRINNYEGNELLDYVLPVYNTNNQLVSYTVYITFNNEGLRFDLTYNPDETITVTEYSGDHVSQNTLISEGIITMGNNQILDETYQNGYQGVFVYDNKNGIFKNISNLQTLNLINIDFSGYIVGGMNNLLSLTENDNGTTDLLEEYEYTYNSNNYPETSNDNVDGVLDSTRQFIYE